MKITVYFLAFVVNLGSIFASDRTWSDFENLSSKDLNQKIIGFYVSEASEDRRFAAELISMLGVDVDTHLKAVVVAVLLLDKTDSVVLEALYASDLLKVEEFRVIYPLIVALKKSQNKDIREVADALVKKSNSKRSELEFKKID